MFSKENQVLGAVYQAMCPNCGGDIADWELVSSGVCSKCLPALTLGENKTSEYAKLLTVEQETKEFRKFFETLMGSRPWALQEIWAKRVLLGRSFSIVAPTGIGKTHFGLIMALYLASKKNCRCYILVPTSLLVKHLLDKVKWFSEKVEVPEVVGYYSGMPRKKAEETLERIKNGNFKVLITTDKFLYNRFEVLNGKTFDFIFVDDVDSFLKSPKNIDKVVLLLGYQPEYIEKCLKDEPVERATDSVLVVSGATLRGRRTKRVKIFRKLLGFEPGYTLEFVRNISGFVLRPERNPEDEVADIIKRFGKGCLVFVPQSKGLNYAKLVVQKLQQHGVRALLYEKMSPKILDGMYEGEYDALVGIASNRSPLARGLDLPEVIRYTVFVGVPRREIRVEDRECNPQKILAVLKTLVPVLEGKLRERVAAVMSSLAKIVPLRADVIERIKEADEREKELEGFDAYARKTILQAREVLREILAEDAVRQNIGRLDINLRIENGQYVLVLPDVDGYIQASGRASRFYAAGISKGISIILVDDEKALNGLKKRLRLFAEEELEEYEHQKVAEEFKQVDLDRDMIRKIRSGQFKVDVLDILRSALIVVESPTKARTIAYLFGSPARRTIENFTVYEVASGRWIFNIVASAGHVFDLTTTIGFHGVLKDNGKYIPVYTDIRRCAKCGEQLTDLLVCPVCSSNEILSKKDTIEFLRKLAFEANEVLIATDPDSEGEKIGYDIYVNLIPYCRNIRRIEFHEVTRKALRKALEEPRGISLPLVQAQTVRRIEDRWVGFELSRRLWEKFERRNLSAGRVQTPVLGWVVNRMEEIRKKIPVVSLRIENGIFLRLQNPPSLVNLKSTFKKGELSAEVSNISTREEKIHPLPPYTTDALLRDASSKLKFSTTYTMELAQTLFECGLITYHRTDSTTVSTTGIELAKRFIEENGLGEFKAREYKKEGAHECIRPTKPINADQLRFYISAGVLRLPQKLTSDHLKLYDMIFRRFIASQMQEATVVVQEFTVRIGEILSKQDRIIRIVDEGFLKINPTVKVEQEVKEGVYSVVEMKIKRESIARPYTQGDLIALMKEKGIGRPSTYSRIIDILFKRNYILQKSGWIFSTSLGRMVYEYLRENFEKFVSEELTRSLESTIDMIENGQVDYQAVLEELEKEINLIKS